MRSPIVWLSLLAIVLAGCGVSAVGQTPSPAATPTFDRAALQQAIDQMANEATIVSATGFALRLDPAADPAVATASARRYQDSVATYTALQPTLIALTPPLAEPQISDAARAAASAAYGAGAARAAASAASMTPAAGQPADEAAMMQRATIAAATMIALGSGASVDPAVATAAVSYYQDTNATIAAYQAPPSAPPTPPAPTAAWLTPTPMPTPDLRDVPIAPAPRGLAGVTLPATQEEVAALFNSMPPAVAGESRDTTTSALTPSLMEVDYGSIPLPDTSQSMPRIILGASDRSRDPFRPGWSGAQIIAVMAREEIPDRVSAWGRDGHIYWLRSTMTPPDPQRTVPNEVLFIGSDASAWVFSLLATSPEELDALAEALAGAL